MSDDKNPPPANDPRLQSIEDRLKSLQDEISPHTTTAPPPSNSTQSQRAGMRAGSELIGGLLGGLMFGYFFDYMVGTKPYGLVTGLLLGVVAGFYGVYRYTMATK